MIDSNILDELRSGCVIPAHPLALLPDNTIDLRSQRALTRYYIDAGARGLAVGVHTTQFAIHDHKVGLYSPALELAIETARQTAEYDEPIMIAGIVGPVEQALNEAQLAADLGYDIGLLSLTALRGKSIDELIDHATRVSEIIPIMGFYLQQTISQMTLPLEFWHRLLEIPNLVAIKVAPFDRYQTLDVLEAVARSGRHEEIALYTGNDDNIILDLITPFEFDVNGAYISLNFAGGLLGQWACWTRRAVQHLDRIKEIRREIQPIPPDLLTLAQQMTLANKAIFDADNKFKGCIPGISYVLKQQGLMQTSNTLDPNDTLSPHQTETIDAIVRDYPYLTDNAFVEQNLQRWMS